MNKEILIFYSSLLMTTSYVLLLFHVLFLLHNTPFDFSPFSKELAALINAIVYHHTREEKYNKELVNKYLENDLEKRLKMPLDITYSDWVEPEETFIEDEDWVFILS